MPRKKPTSTMPPLSTFTPADVARNLPGWRERAAEAIDAEPKPDADYALVSRAQRLYSMLVPGNAPVTAGDGAIARAVILAALLVGQQ